MRRPAQIAFDAQGVLHLADSGDARILKFDEYGNYLGETRSPLLARPRGLDFQAGRMLVADEEAGVLEHHLETGLWSRIENIRDDDDNPLDFTRPFAARMDRNGLLYVADYGSDRAVLFSPRGLRFSNLDCRIQKLDRSSYPEMAVFLTVKDRMGRPVRGLERSEVVVNENGRRTAKIRVDNMRPFENKVAIAIVKENSDLFREKYDDYLDTSLGGLLGPLRITDRLTLIRVGEQVRPVYEGLERKRILRFMKSGETTGKPNLGKGLFEGVSSLKERIGPRHVLVVTSGAEFPGTFNQYSSQKIIQYARANEISISVVSFEDGGPWREMARLTGGRHYGGFQDAELAGIYDDLREKGDSRYIVTYCSPGSNDCDPWWVRLILWRFGAGAPSGRYLDVRTEVRHFGTYGVADGGYFTP